MPLAHILAPQIAARVSEIEAALGPPQGYLAQTNVGFEKTPYDPRGLIDKPEAKEFDGRTVGGQMLKGIGILQRSGDPIAQKVARGFLAGIAGKIPGVQGTYRAPQAGQAIDPKGKTGSQSMLALMPGRSEPIGMTESGEPIYKIQTAPAAAPRGPVKLKLKRGEAAGFDEKGESVDPKGKKLGYLYLSAPTVAAPGRELTVRDLLRRKTDAAVYYRDKFGAGALQQLYTPHLKAMQDNFQDTGREEFPTGYFNNMSPAKRKDIEDGVKALREMESGQPT